VVLQVKLIREINDTLSNIIKVPERMTLSRLVKIRQVVYRNLEEYLNTRIQRYEI